MFCMSCICYTVANRNKALCTHTKHTYSSEYLIVTACDSECDTICTAVLSVFL